MSVFIQLTLFESYITRGELARAFHRTPPTISRWAKRSGMPAHYVGGRIRYLLSECLEWYDAAILSGEVVPQAVRIRRVIGQEVRYARK